MYIFTIRSFSHFPPFQDCQKRRFLSDPCNFEKQIGGYREQKKEGKTFLFYRTKSSQNNMSLIICWQQ